MTPYYEDDLVTLYHGDCRQITAWLDADVLVTDPPYGRSWRQRDVRDVNGMCRGEVHAKNEASATGIANDDDTAVRDEILEQWGNRPAIVFGDLMLPPPAGTRLVCVYHKADKAAGLRGAVAGVRRDAEAIYLVGKWPVGIGGRTSLFASRARITGAQGAVARAGGHPHTKPNEVMEELIGLTTGTVADPATGGGQHVGRG